MQSNRNLGRFGHSTTSYGNMGVVDRSLRAIGAVAAIAQILLLSGPIEWQVYLPLAGVYLAATAMMGWDPLYHLAGVHTCARSGDHSVQDRRRSERRLSGTGEPVSARAAANDSDHSCRAA